MKKMFFLSLLMAAVLVSCETQNQTINNLDQLKRVDFSEEGGQKVISEEKTGNIVYDNFYKRNRYEYRVTVQKSYHIAPMSVVSETMSDVIYPGSIIRGDEFMNAKYSPVTLRNDFEPVELSVTLNGKDIKVSKSVMPTLSQVRQARNDLIAGQMDKIGGQYIPAIIQYDNHEITTEESFKRSLKIHASIEVVGGIAKGSFGYDESKSSNTQEKYVMIAFRQFLYNMAIDPKHYSKWIKGDVDTQDMGEYEPLYISSVDYGRTGYILLKTTQTAEEAKKIIEAAVSVAIKYGKGEASLKYSEDFTKLFSEKRITIKIVGGPAELAAGVNSPESFADFIKAPKAEELIASSAPIAYKVRRLRDNTEVDVIDVYKEFFYELRDE